MEIIFPTFYQSFREGDNFPKGIICIELGERAKTTLNVPYRLTTEMGECRGCKNSTGLPQGQGQR